MTGSAKAPVFAPCDHPRLPIPNLLAAASRQNCTASQAARATRFYVCFDRCKACVCNFKKFQCCIFPELRSSQVLSSFFHPRSEPLSFAQEWQVATVASCQRRNMSSTSGGENPNPSSSQLREVPRSEAVLGGTYSFFFFFRTEKQSAPKTLKSRFQPGVVLLFDHFLIFFLSLSPSRSSF